MEKERIKLVVAAIVLMVFAVRPSLGCGSCSVTLNGTLGGGCVTSGGTATLAEATYTASNFSYAGCSLQPTDSTITADGNCTGGKNLTGFVSNQWFFFTTSDCKMHNFYVVSSWICTGGTVKNSSSAPFEAQSKKSPCTCP